MVHALVCLPCLCVHACRGDAEGAAAAHRGAAAACAGSAGASARAQGACLWYRTLLYLCLFFGAFMWGRKQRLLAKGLYGKTAVILCLMRALDHLPSKPIGMVGLRLPSSPPL